MFAYDTALGIYRCGHRVESLPTSNLQLFQRMDRAPHVRLMAASGRLARCGKSPMDAHVRPRTRCGSDQW